MADGIMKEAQSKGAGQADIRYLTPLSIDTGKKEKLLPLQKRQASNSLTTRILISC